MAEHTKGPLRICGGFTPGYSALYSDADGYIVFGFADYLDDREHNEPIKCPSYDVQDANRRRLAAAWNAVIPLSTEALESGVIADLIEALEDIKHCTDPDSAEENYRADDTEGCLDTVFSTASQALAKLKGSS